MPSVGLACLGLHSLLFLPLLPLFALMYETALRMTMMMMMMMAVEDDDDDDDDGDDDDG